MDSMTLGVVVVVVFFKWLGKMEFLKVLWI